MEGKSSTKIIKELARDRKINVAITEFVDAVLSGTKPRVAFNNLWEQLKKEQ